MAEHGRPDGPAAESSLSVPPQPSGDSVPAAVPTPAGLSAGSLTGRSGAAVRAAAAGVPDRTISPAGPAALTGKRIRLRRLIDPETGTCRIVALDHGMTSPMFLEGLTDTASRVRESVDGGANVLMLGRGVAGSCWQEFAGRASLALMLTAAAAGRPGGATITPIGSVPEALRIGADAVVVYVALGGEDEPDMIRYLSGIGGACDEHGIPLIAEAEFPNAYASRDSVDGRYGAAYLRRNARLCAELGADIVKVNWSGDTESFASIVSACGRPVVLAGGPVLPDAELLGRMEQARQAGAIGYSVGRNVFEHAHPEAMTRALTSIFRSGTSAAAALDQLRAESAGRAGAGGAGGGAGEAGQ